MAGIPQQQLEELQHINNKLADIKQDVDEILHGGIPVVVDLTPVTDLLEETNRLLAVLVTNTTEHMATSLGGTVEEVPVPPKP